jgi:Mrp family chromosome partitioning ATPase/capsular polysaccharide biosynthesis protein
MSEFDDSRPIADVDVGRYFRVLLRWSWLVLLAAAIAGAASYRTSQFLPRTYQSSATLLVGDYASNPNVSPDQLATSQRLAATYSEMIQREPVLSATVTALQLPTDWQALKLRLLVIHYDGSQIIQIRVVDSDPKRAQAIVQELIHQVVLQSPTQQSLADREQQRQFLQQQVDSLQANIKQGEDTLAADQAKLQHEDSARAVLDLQDEIKALDLKLTAWRTTYASLLSAAQVNPSNTLNVIEPPSLENQPISPNVRANVLLATALGMLAAVTAVCAIEYFNDTLNRAEDVARMPVSPILATLGHAGRIKKPADSLITILKPYSRLADRFRLLRRGILVTCADDGLVPLVVTSPGMNEGKSFTSANLAVSFAQGSQSVILVDTDIRNPVLHRLFACSNETGLSGILNDEAIPGQLAIAKQIAGSIAKPPLEQLIEQHLVLTPIPGLRFLPAGPLLANPAELLGSARMSQLLPILQGMADIVVLDSPPILPVADTPLLTSNRTVVLMVVEAGRTKAHDLHQAFETLRQSRSRVLGVILNKTWGKGTDNGRYARYYRPPHKPAAHGSWLPFRRRSTEESGHID